MLRRYDKLILDRIERRLFNIRGQWNIVLPLILDRIERSNFLKYVILRRQLLILDRIESTKRRLSTKSVTRWSWIELKVIIHHWYRDRILGLLILDWIESLYCRSYILVILRMLILDRIERERYTICNSMTRTLCWSWIELKVFIAISLIPYVGLVDLG